MFQALKQIFARSDDAASPAPAVPQGQRVYAVGDIHAAVLGFVHPVTSDRLRFTSDLPPDMQELIDETAHSDR